MDNGDLHGCVKEKLVVSNNYKTKLQECESERFDIISPLIIISKVTW